LVGRDLSVFLKKKFQELVGEGTAAPQEVEVVMGRKLQVCAKFYIAEARTEHISLLLSNFSYFLFSSSGSIGS
jgi:hypothetical protein